MDSGPILKLTRLEDEIMHDAALNEAIAEALPAHYNFEVFSSSLLHSSPELSDKKVYEPQIQALLGTASHFCQVVVLNLGTGSGGAGDGVCDAGRDHRARHGPLRHQGP